MPFYQVGDVKLHYETLGSGAPIVFLPGLGCCSKAWRPQAEYFSADNQVILMDYRGHGESDPGRDEYTIDLFADDLMKLLGSLRTPPAVLCGLSMGSLVAQQFCHRHPSMCRALILCGAHSHPGLKERIVGRLVPPALKKYFRTKTVQEFARATAKKVFAKADQQRIRDVYASEVIATTPEGYLRSWHAVSLFDSLRYLSAIEVPTLVYHGQNDEAFVRGQAAIFMRRLRRVSHAVMSDAYHIINLEKPDEFNRTVSAFLKELGTDGAPQES